MVHGKQSEFSRLELGVQHADIAAADRTGGTWYHVNEFRSIRAKLFSSLVAQTKVITLQLKQAKDTSGTDAKALGSLVTVTAPTGGSVLSAEAEAYSNELDINNGFEYVNVTVGSDGTSIAGCCVFEFTDLRNYPAS